MNWWDKASTEERLAQIDGGIECCMTSRQVAIASRTSMGAVIGFAARHGRSFPNVGATPNRRRMGRIVSDRAAYLRGDRVDLWGGEAGVDEFGLDEVA